MFERDPNGWSRELRGAPAHLPDFSYETIIERGGESYSFAVMRAGSYPFQVSASLNRRDAWCDCFDVRDPERAYRPHLFLGIIDSQTQSYEERLRRVTVWQRSLIIFDEQMYEPEDTSVESLLENLSECRIPKARYADCATWRKSLGAILRGMGAVGNGEYRLPWERLIEGAKNGEIVDRWIEYKKLHSRMS